MFWKVLAPMNLTESFIQYLPVILFLFQRPKNTHVTLPKVLSIFCTLIFFLTCPTIRYFLHRFSQIFLMLTHCSKSYIRPGLPRARLSTLPHSGSFTLFILLSFRTISALTFQKAVDFFSRMLRKHLWKTTQTLISPSRISQVR